MKINNNKVFAIVLSVLCGFSYPVSAQCSKSCVGVENHHTQAEHNKEKVKEKAKEVVAHIKETAGELRDKAVHQTEKKHKHMEAQAALNAKKTQTLLEVKKEEGKIQAKEMAENIKEKSVELQQYAIEKTSKKLESAREKAEANLKMAQVNLEKVEAQLEAQKAAAKIKAAELDALVKDIAVRHEENARALTELNERKIEALHEIHQEAERIKASEMAENLREKNMQLHKKNEAIKNR